VTCERGWFSRCGTQLTARMLGRSYVGFLCMYIWKTHVRYLVPRLPALDHRSKNRSIIVRRVRHDIRAVSCVPQRLNPRNRRSQDTGRSLPRPQRRGSSPYQRVTTHRSLHARASRVGHRRLRPSDANDGRSGDSAEASTELDDLCSATRATGVGSRPALVDSSRSNSAEDPDGGISWSGEAWPGNG